MPDSTIHGDVAAAIDAARPNLDTLVDYGDSVVVATRDDIEVRTVDFESLGSHPTRSRGSRRVNTYDGLVTALNTLDSATAIVYVDEEALSVEAVLNDDLAGTGWRDHRVKYSPRLTPAWRHWIDNIGLHPQDKFAEILEAGEPDITSPSATVMLDIAQTFQASTAARFKQAGRTRDGRTQLVYEEDIEATAGDGMVEIPERFVVSIAPFYGAAMVDVECRIRYRLRGGEFTIGYSITRPDDILREAFHSDVLQPLIQFARGDAAAFAWPIIEGVAPEATTRRS